MKIEENLFLFVEKEAVYILREEEKIILPERFRKKKLQNVHCVMAYLALFEVNN